MFGRKREEGWATSEKEAVTEVYYRISTEPTLEDNLRKMDTVIYRYDRVKLQLTAYLGTDVSLVSTETYMMVWSHTVHDGLTRPGRQAHTTR